MIYDTFENLHLYKGISKDLDVALDYLSAADLKSLSLGRHELSGDRVFINVMDAELKPMAQGGFEAHRNYLDIQVDIDGQEIIGVTPNGEAAGRMEETQAYKPENDVVLFKGEADVYCPMGPGRFLILFPSDVHAPGLTDQEPKTIRKMVGKVICE